MRCLRVALIPLFSAGLLAACASPAQKRSPLVVQVERVGDAQFTPGIDVVSRLESTASVALRPEVDGRVVKILATRAESPPLRGPSHGLGLSSPSATVKGEANLTAGSGNHHAAG